MKVFGCVSCIRLRWMQCLVRKLRDHRAKRFVNRGSLPAHLFDATQLTLGITYGDFIHSGNGLLEFIFPSLSRSSPFLRRGLCENWEKCLRCASLLWNDENHKAWRFNGNVSGNVIFCCYFHAALMAMHGPRGRNILSAQSSLENCFKVEFWFQLPLAAWRMRNEHGIVLWNTRWLTYQELLRSSIRAQRYQRNSAGCFVVIVTLLRFCFAINICRMCLNADDESHFRFFQSFVAAT